MSAMAKENRGLNARMSSLEKKTEDLSAEVRAFRTLSGPPLEEGHGERTIKNAGQMSFEQRSFYERPKSFIAIDYPALGLPRDFVVIDTSPLNAVSDSLAISSVAAGMVVVVRENKTTVNDLDKAINSIKMANGQILGFILTDVDSGGGSYGYGKYGYGYGYGESSKKKK